MISFSRKRYVALLWGISVLFSMESKGASIQQTISISSTAEPDQTTKQLDTLDAHQSETETQPTMHDLTAAEYRVAAETAVSTTVENKVSYISDSSTVGLVVMNTEAVTTSSSDPQHGSIAAPAVTTASSKEHSSHNTTSSETAKHTELPQSQSTSIGMNAPATAPATTPAATPATVSEMSSTTVAMSSSMSTYINELDATNKSYSTISPDNSMPATQNFSSHSNFSTNATITNTTSEASHEFDPDSTSSPDRISEISTVSTELSSMSQPVSATRSLIFTSHPSDTARQNSTTELLTSSVSTDPANSTAVSTSLAGVLIPRVPKMLPIPTTKSTPAITTAVHEISPSTEVKPCSVHGVMKQCLIAIASLAGVATIFMVSTIVLCVKLSARKYKVKRPRQETEMMCISSLLPDPDRNYNYTRQRNPITNGVLVIPNGRDYDADGGDDLTLSSFLPDNDRYI